MLFSVPRRREHGDNEKGSVGTAPKVQLGLRQRQSERVVREIVT
jgi:hypothetical protein